MPYDCREAANFVLDRADELGLPVTNFHLNKVLYFCHGWWMTEFGGEPFIDQEFEAWQHGPVVRTLYQQFRSFGKEPIAGRATKLDSATGSKIVVRYRFSNFEADFASQVMDFYIQMPFSRLYEVAHVKDGPWDRVWHHDSLSNPGMIIPNELIRDFFDSWNFRIRRRVT